MKYPKGFNNWNLDKQESWLSAQRVKVLEELDTISRQLAKVRGGMKIQARVEDVPGLDYETIPDGV